MTDPPKPGAAIALMGPQLRALRDVWRDVRTSDTVAESDIRRWAIAVYWPDTPPRLYWDVEYASTTTWGGIVAPPDFNPFAWPARRPPSTDGVRNDPTAERGSRSMNAGQVEEYFAPIRPGDRITSRTCLRGWRETTTRLGPSLFLVTEIEWTNARAELVKRRTSTSVRY
jgi:MaoC dehydratase-like protein